MVALRKRLTSDSFSDVAPRPNGRGGSKPRPIAGRFWKKVQKTETCWLWTGATWTGSRGERSYGAISDGYKTKKAHALSWEMANGQQVPSGLVVRHSCHNPLCVNPAHLSVGTHADNRQDMLDAGRSRPGGRRLSPMARAEVSRRLLSGESVLSLSREFGVTRNSLHQQKNRLVARKAAAR